MSDTVELAFRQRLVGAFADELGDRVYDLVSPPDAGLPLATYRRLGSDRSGWTTEARLAVTFRAERYTDVKRLQAAVERHCRELRRTWLGPVDDGCSVWVHHIEVVTGADGLIGATRHRTATSEFVIHYGEGA